VTITVVLHDNGGTANGGSDTSAAQTFVIVVNQIQLIGTTLIAEGSSQGGSLSVSVSDDGSNLAVTLDGGSQTYDMSAVHKFVFNGQPGVASSVIFADRFGSFSVAQSISGIQLVGTNFEFDSSNAANVYVYGNSNSKATVDVSNGIGSNFFVDDVDNAYSYIADPVQGTYSELSGFGSVTAAGSNGATYAYIYSTSHAAVVGGPGQTTFTSGGVTTTLSNFPQVYVVGSSDGTDSVTLNSAGGEFVSTPSFSYVSGSSNGANFLVGALFCANVTAQASSTGTDTAVFYSYPHDTFDGTPGTSSLSGSTTNSSGSSVTFVNQARGYRSVSVFESGSGSDVANLTSPGHGSLYSIATGSILVVGTSTITVNTYVVLSGETVAIPSQIVVTGNHDGTDSATVYDSTGDNALNASGSAATLSTASMRSVTVNKFGSVSVIQHIGTLDTSNEAAIDYSLSTVGNWTNA
jgi:hypothetical protein